MEWADLRAHRTGDPVRLAVANRKGGSGKTTTAINLGAALAAWGLRVRLIDGDPQLASATYWLPPQRPAPWPTLLDVYMGEASLSVVTAPTTVERLAIAPSLDTLGQVELQRPPGADLLLAGEMDADPDPPDVEIMDAPPSLGTVTVSMLAAARHLIVAQRASGLDYVGTAELGRPVELVRRRLAPDLAVTAVVLVATTARATITAGMVDRLAQEYPGALVHQIPHSVRATEAPGAHQPMQVYAPTSPVTVAYWRLAAALVPRLGLSWTVAPVPELLGEVTPA